MKDPGELLTKISKLQPSQQVVDELVSLVRGLFEEFKQKVDLLEQENRRLKDEIQLLKDEITSLKNQPPRPKIEPSKLEKNNKAQDKKNWSKSSKNQSLVIDREVKIAVPNDQKPEGSIFKGYRDYIVQELIVKKEVTRYRLEQWEKPDGTYVSAKLPEAIGDSHFGPGLRQEIVNLSVAGRVPQGRIRDALRDKKIAISKGQVNAILQKEAAALRAEKEQILHAGLKLNRAQTDDTAARHKGKNGVATVIGNEFFSYFKSTNSKSRINFLEILCGEKVEYSITQDTISYLKTLKISPSNLAIMEKAVDRKFADHDAWQAFLQVLCPGKVMQRLFTEGALIGALIERGTVTIEMILMSDGAGQFVLFVHILCWIHVERSIKRLIPVNDNDRKEIEHVLNDFWNFYRDLKSYKASLPEMQITCKQELNKRFDEIFSFQATEIPLAMALKKIRDHKQELLLVLDHPDLPLHNNMSEGDIREYVTKRKVAGGTRSDNGRDARDTLVSLYKTCRKLGISFWDYLGDRISKINNIPSLANVILKKIALRNAKLSAAGP